MAFFSKRLKSSICVSANKQEIKRNFQLYKRVFLMNVLNPKVTLFFLAFFPKFIDPNGNTILETYKLGLLFMAQGILVFSSVAILAAQLKNTINKPTFHHFIKWFQIVVLLGIGIFVVL